MNLSLLPPNPKSIPCSRPTAIHHESSESFITVPDLSFAVSHSVSVVIVYPPTCLIITVGYTYLQDLPYTSRPKDKGPHELL